LIKLYVPIPVSKVKNGNDNQQLPNRKFPIEEYNFNQIACVGTLA
jgi:hypothetical protein